MAYHIQSSFSAGELDPALFERTTFDKYQTGLATLRNAVIGKTGRMVSRPGTQIFKAAKYNDKKCVLYSPPYSQYVVEWGDLYVRIHDTVTGTYTDDAHTLTEADLPNIQFVSSDVTFVYVFLVGNYISKLDLLPAAVTRLLGSGVMFTLPSGPTYASNTNTGTGHDVQYAFTCVLNGEESETTGVYIAGAKVPILVTESNTYNLTLPTSSAYATEIRAYRQPINGAATSGAYGYIGSAPVTFGSPSTAKFQDLGQDADYTHSPPGYTTPATFDPLNKAPRTGCIYQQRLLMTESPTIGYPNNTNEEVIYASRTGFKNNFTRDYPLGADSSLVFKSGTSGSAKVLRMIDNNGLLVFTTAGIFYSIGALTPDNLALEKKGNWVIEETIPPLEVPGGILFVDKSTNTVRTLIYSQEANGFPGDEISIFSNHLFVNKKVVSWAFQEGDIPLIWVVMDDGSLNALTYQREHQMQAWSRHDTDGIYESVTVLKDLTNKSVAYFVVNRNGQRLIETTTPRFTPDLKDFNGTDSSITFKTIVASDILVEAQDITDWGGLLVLTSASAVFANTTDNGAVGSVFRFFDSDGSAVDLTVTTFVSTSQVIVQASAEFPAYENINATIYKTYATVTGLDHLNGKLVSVLSDGYVISSPNNNNENYDEITVSNGAITLPDGMRGAIIHVGLPFTVDLETLDVDTVEQKPTLLESRTVNKVYVKVYNTRGIFVGAKFASNNQVDGMVDPEERTEDIELGNIGNAAQKPVTKRHDIVIRNDWQSNGRVCIRQVDPLPVEVLSIIPDMSILY